MKLVDIIPPLVLKWIIHFRDFVFPEYRLIKLKKELLFDGKDRMFKRELACAEIYVEVGCGQSTVFACKQAHILHVVAIDTSSDWLKLVSIACNDEKLILHHSDFGTLGNWGRPLSYWKIHSVRDYTAGIFKHHQPDLVLIDGRFRVYCFLYCCVFGREGIRIIFDDYVGRNYNIVESVILPKEIYGRQALFVLDDSFDRVQAKVLLDKFEYVMD
jgi:hypothetical protein